MRKVRAAFGSAVFLVIAPGFVAGVVPWWISGWRLEPPFLGISFFRLLGGALAALGIAVLVDSFARFALEGLGTPSPLFPTRHLVISGLYRYVRNPMYYGVVATVLGQGLLFGSVPLLVYAAAVWLMCHGFVVGYEERKLRGSFGAEFEAYCLSVPRWVPRLTPWRPKD